MTGQAPPWPPATEPLVLPTHPPGWDKKDAVIDYFERAIRGSHEPRLQVLESFRTTDLPAWRKATDKRLGVLEDPDTGYSGRLDKLEDFKNITEKFRKDNGLDDFKKKVVRFQLDATKRLGDLEQFEQDANKERKTTNNRLDGLDKFKTGTGNSITKLETGHDVLDKKLGKLEALQTEDGAKLDDLQKFKKDATTRLGALEDFNKNSLNPFVSSTTRRLSDLAKEKLDTKDYLGDKSKTEQRMKILEDFSTAMINNFTTNKDQNDAQFGKLEDRVKKLEDRTTATDKEVDTLKTTVGTNHTNVTSQIKTLQEKTDGCFNSVTKAIKTLTDDVKRLDKKVDNVLTSGGPGNGRPGKGEPETGGGGSRPGWELQNYNSPRGTNIKLDNFGDINFNHSPICSRFNNSFNHNSPCICGGGQGFNPGPPMPTYTAPPPSYAPGPVICPIAPTAPAQPLPLSQFLQNDIPICINNSANADATNNNNSFNSRRRRHRSASPGRSRGRHHKSKESVEGAFQSFSGPSIRVNFTRNVPGGLFGKGRSDSLGFCIGGGAGDMGFGKGKKKVWET